MSTTRIRTLAAPSLAELPGAWRTEADNQRDWGNESAARALERAAGQLEIALKRDQDELLTLRQASQISGYSEDHLGRLVRQEKLANHGRRNAPRVRRGELPKKVQLEDGHDAVLPLPSKAQTARAVVTSLRGA